jgi:nitrogen fixation/metabolism regulation signal transduction histidine kinase
MTHDDALRLLSSTAPHERLKAARLLARDIQSNDLPMLRTARRTEVVSYVQASLDLAIARHAKLTVPPTPDPVDEYTVHPDVKQQIWSQAVEWITGLVLHEIASPVGLVRLAASREVKNYENSETKSHLDSVGRIFEAIEQLKGAASVPKPQHFDLTQLLNEIIAAESMNRAIPVSLHGPQPLMITSDPTLIRFAVCNGLRNAFESVERIETPLEHSIILSWGETEIDYWVCILDKGPGILGPMASAFEIGKTTKEGHSGFGLAIARQAIETLGGSVNLQSAIDGGARYEARWER